jgi:hypothetical protein
VGEETQPQFGSQSGLSGLPLCPGPRQSTEEKITRIKKTEKKERDAVMRSSKKHSPSGNVKIYREGPNNNNNNKNNNNNNNNNNSHHKKKKPHVAPGGGQGPAIKLAVRSKASQVRYTLLFPSFFSFLSLLL